MKRRKRIPEQTRSKILALWATKLLTPSEISRVVGHSRNAIVLLVDPEKVEKLRAYKRTPEYRKKNRRWNRRYYQEHKEEVKKNVYAYQLKKKRARNAELEAKKALVIARARELGIIQ